MDKNSFDGIPHGFLQKWQEIADLLASILEVPAALIMKNENEFMEVFTTSNTANNPYKPGDKEHWHGLYCETVIKEQKKLRIPNALKDKDWDKNPDIKLGMIAYLGYPLNFPDQSPFGTLCVLDNKERHFSSDNEKLLLQFKKVLEIDLALIFSLELKEDYSHVDLIQKLSQDNEELKKTKEELTKSADHLKHSHELMDYIIKHNRSAIAVHDRDLNYVFVSQRYLDVYKVKETDVIGKHHYDVFPDLPQKWREVHQKSLKGEVISAEEDPYYHEDGRVDWTRWECRPWYEKNGSIGGIIVYTEIITERLQQENDLRKSEENLSITLNSIGDAVISTDINGSVVKMNPVAQKLCGWKLSDAIGKSLPEVFKIINAHSRQSVTNPVEKVMKEGKTVGLANHTVLISRDGNEYQISDSAAPIKNKEGEISGVVMVFSDVTEKYIAERKLKESEERFHLAMNASNDGLWDWNLETNDIYYSPAWKKMLGYQEHELPNDFSVWENLTQPDDVKKSWELQQKLIDKQIDQFVVEFKMRHKQGHWVDILSRAKAIFNDKGKAVRIVGTHTDITERKNYEDALRKSQEMLLTSQSVAHICSYSTNLNITDLEKSSWVCSPQFYEIFGIDKTYPHTIKDWMGFIHPAYRKEMVAYHKSVVDEKKSFNREYKIIRLNDGVERWVHGTGELEYDEQGKPVRMHGAIQDITERKKIEEQIRQSQHLLQTILDNLPIGLAFNKIDEGKATYMNKKFIEIYGWEKRDLVNIKTFFEKVYPDKNYREKVMEQVMTDIKSGDPQKMHWENLTITRKDGTHRIINAVNIPLIDQNTMVSTVLDVTKERQAEEVRKELQVTRKTAQFKQNFLANMSHEIRTPLTGVLGMIEIMEQTSLTDDQKDYL
ncbi:MAG: PAS domain S-box protein, partial [Bacteroidota bacterium]